MSRAPTDIRPTNKEAADREDRFQPLLEVTLGSKIQRINHLLVIAGPSGAGKTTFIGQMARDDLSRDLREILPPYCQNWPLAVLRRESDRVISRPVSETQIDGLVLHFSIGTCWKYEILQQLFSRSNNITIITIRISAKTLANQLVEKRFTKRRRSSPSVTGRWKAFHMQLSLQAASAVRQIRRRIPGTVLERLKRYGIAVKIAGWSDEMPWEGKLSSKITKARKKGRVEGQYAGWDEILSSVSEDRELHIIDLEQRADDCRPYGWQIANPP